MITNNFAITHNNQVIAVNRIPVYDYSQFTNHIIELMKDNPQRHCVNYFGYPVDRKIKLLCCVADDVQHNVFVSSSMVDAGAKYASLTAQNHNFEKFERELHENFGISYVDHPWLKPLRYAHDRANASSTVESYPFYAIESEDLHEVGVGPIHAGIIEPGHFRFICNGEQIMHLEIQLGYQHRGVERLMREKQRPIERATLAENIAGDTTVGHATAFANLWECICDHPAGYSLHYDRTIALELERIAIHTGDLAAICGDVAYQLGNAVYGRLRTPMVNFFQEWCGNRLAKGLVRVGYTNYPFTSSLAERLMDIFKHYERDFEEMNAKFFSLPSAMSRMEKTGVVSYEEALDIGAVGMAARASGLLRDVRYSHHHGLYNSLIHAPVVKHHGDVYSRVQIRRDEIRQSMGYLRQITETVPELKRVEPPLLTPLPGIFALSLVEGWRGEICHCAVTDALGQLAAYKIKDPSHHNWMALSQSVRDNEISDFPLCNKSFNLSYCGHDL